MSADRAHQHLNEMVVYDEPVRAHLSLDPWWDQLTVIRFGSVWDGQPDGCVGQLASDERLLFLFEEPDEPVIGFMVCEPDEFHPEGVSDPLVWDGARFEVPLLGLTNASIGEVVLGVQGRFAEGEPTNDAMFFHMAIDAAANEEDLEKAAWCYRMALEAGDQKARYGLGYTLVELGQHRQAYDNLRLYTELTPHNSWAWCWLGRACEGLGERTEAERAYRRAIELEEEGSFETDAPGLLASLVEGDG
jgi:predicted Zn-dependent protease